MQFPNWSWDLVGCVQIYDSNSPGGGGLVKITTDGGSITFPTYSISITTIASLDINTNGGDINIPARIDAYVSDLGLTLNAGSDGVITFSTRTGNLKGGFLKQINVENAKYVSLKNNIQLYGPFTCTPSVHVEEGHSVDICTTGSSYVSGGGDVLLQGGVEGPGSISFNVGLNHSVTTASVGRSFPVSSFSIDNPNNIKNISLSNVMTSSGNILINVPLVLTGNDTILSSKGGNITLPSSTTFTGSKNSLTIDAEAGDINIPGIPSFNSISILGRTVTVGSGLSASGKITLGHTGTAMINGGISAGEDFLDTGTGILSTTSNVSANTISFTGSPTLTGTFTATSSISFGSSTKMSGKFTAGTSMSATGSVRLAGTTTLTAPSGIAIGSQISSIEASDLILDASAASISIGGDVVGLRSFTVKSASDISFFDISTQGDIVIPCPAQLRAGSVISSDGGNITFGNTLNPSIAGCDLTINSNSDKASGAISLKGLGTAGISFDNISLYGGLITLSQSVSLSGTFGISNSEPITISSGNVVVGGSFNQLGTAAVSLGSSITAGGAISFKGPLTIMEPLALVGPKGVTLSGPITASSVAPDITLDVGSHSLILPSLGTSAVPFGAVSIKASNLVLNGDITTDSSIFIGSPISIAQATTLTGVHGISITGTVSASRGTPSLTLLASSGPVETRDLGNETAPLGAVSLTGIYIVLGGNVTSNASIILSGAITITNNISLTADQDITLDQNLSRSTDPFNLTLQASDGSVSVQGLGDSVSPLKNVSLIGMNGVTVSGTITTTGLLTITNGEGTTICGPGTYPPCNSQSQ
jgi:hypothetical protein